MWGKICYKEVFLRLSVCVVYYCDFIIGRLNYYCIGMYPAYICIFLRESADDYITQANEIPGRLTSGYLVGSKQLLWSGLTVLSGDVLSDGRRFNCPCDLRLPYLYLPDLKHRLQKIQFVKKKKMIGWKIDLFFITGNFLGILNRLCAEPMRRSHDFLSLTRPVVGSTSGRCYFLQQYRCLLVCVLCVLVVRCVKC